MAKKILVASHGKFAGGLQSSIDILTGQGSSLQVINAYLDDSDYTDQIQAFVDDLQADDQGLVFTDLLGGSVNQRVVNVVMRSGKREQVFIVSNVNLGTVLSLLLYPGEITPEVIDEQIQTAYPQLVRLTQTDDEDDFLD